LRLHQVDLGIEVAGMGCMRCGFLLQVIDDVLVTFTPSEGTLTTGSSYTRGGTVVGTFTAAPGSDSPRTAFLVVTVEDVEVTVFIDLVPAVFGR